MSNHNSHVISNPRFGWCSFCLESKTNVYSNRASYLTNVPVDLLEAFVNYKNIGSACVVFDTEGSYFTLVLTEYDRGIYVIADEDKAMVYNFSDLKIDDLIADVVTTIRENLDDWISFSAFTGEEIDENRKRIEELLTVLEK